eukprot:1037920-Prymnesium_polylepis.1
MLHGSRPDLTAGREHARHRVGTDAGDAVVPLVEFALTALANLPLVIRLSGAVSLVVVEDARVHASAAYAALAAGPQCTHFRKWA